MHFRLSEKRVQFPFVTMRQRQGILHEGISWVEVSLYAQGNSICFQGYAISVILNELYKADDLKGNDFLFTVS